MPTPLLPATTTKSRSVEAPGELQQASASSAQANTCDARRPLTTVKVGEDVTVSSRGVAPAIGQSRKILWWQTYAAEERIARAPVAVKV